jgi:hypothetical protein
MQYSRRAGGQPGSYKDRQEQPRVCIGEIDFEVAADASECYAERDALVEPMTWAPDLHDRANSEKSPRFAFAKADLLL